MGGSEDVEEAWSLGGVNLTNKTNAVHLRGNSKGRAIEEQEYSILLVMSELSIVRCDRAIGLWIAGTRASSVDGEQSKDQAHDHIARLTIHSSRAG